MKNYLIAASFLSLTVTTNIAIAADTHEKVIGSNKESIVSPEQTPLSDKEITEGCKKALESFQKAACPLMLRILELQPTGSNYSFWMTQANSDLYVYEVIPYASSKAWEALPAGQSICPDIKAYKYAVNGPGIDKELFCGNPLKESGTKRVSSKYVSTIDSLFGAWTRPALRAAILGGAPNQNSRQAMQKIVELVEQTENDPAVRAQKARMRDLFKRGVDATKPE